MATDAPGEGAAVSMRGVEELKHLVDAYCRIAVGISVAEARALVDEIDRTSTLMPLLDPTAYMAIAATLPGHRDAAQAFLEFRLALERLKDGGR